MAAIDKEKLLSIMDALNSKERIREYVRFCDSYNRLPMLLDICHLTDADDWLTVLGEAWTSFDNISQYSCELDDSPLFMNWLPSAGPHWAMMDEAEREGFNRLPDEVIVYRGCYAHNKDGLSWTLNKDIAQEFPTLNRYRHDGQPLLVKARVRKENILAVKLDREEMEVIAYRPKHISTSHIKRNT